ncbi:MAG: DNA gyrase inhibitor YacG [Candidatus Rokuibacteriota bacterium]
MAEEQRGVRCPTCRARVAWDGNPHRPFCSLTCRLIDLGVWLDEGYRIPTEKREDVP